MKNSSPSPLDIDSLNVLFADDDPDISEMLGRFLERVGFGKITVVRTAEEALDFIADIEKRRSQLHTLITDLSIPIAGGGEILRASRRLSLQPYNVVFTGYDEESLSPEIRELYDRYILKGTAFIPSLRAIQEATLSHCRIAQKNFFEV